MTRFERVMLYAVSAVVFGAVVASQMGGARPLSGDGVVHAADVDDNQPLDVLRRGVGYARDAHLAETKRAIDLQRSPVSLGDLQNGIAFCQKIYLDEHDRAQKLDKSSAAGDRAMAKAAYQRSGDFNKLEEMLRRLYGTEAQQLVKLYESNQQTVRAATEAASSWKSIAEALTYAYSAEANRLKGLGIK